MSDFPLSVILPVLAGVERADRTLACLRAQTREDFEVVLVVPAGSEPPEVPGLRCRVVAVDAATAAEAYAAGIRRAEGQVVALAEDHVFPPPEWAERLLAAHEGPWAAVGPAMANANPATLASRADLVLNFLEWIEPASGRAGGLPPHNSSYEKETLLEVAGDHLVEALASERVLHYELAERGLYVDGELAVEHVNMSRLGPFLRHKLLGGWIFAGLRCGGWSAGRRAAFALGSPLLPALRWSRILPRLLRLEERGRYLAAAPLIMLGLLLHAAGECLGYLTGPEAARARYRDYTAFESRRWELITEADRRALLGADGRGSASES